MATNGDVASRRTDTLVAMKLVREFERRLDGLLDGLAGRVFSGPLHPTELATRLIRTADLSLDDDLIAHNRFRVLIPEADGEPSAPSDLTDELARLIDATALERGWRLEGPAEVVIAFDPVLRRGAVSVTSARSPGPRQPWAVLSGQHDRLPITVNRASIGRDRTCDVVVRHDQVSRRHCVLWTSNEQLWLRDSGSSNGTWVDGERVSDDPHPFEPGAVIRLADLGYRFELA